MHGRLLSGRGFEGRTAAQQRGRRRDLGAVLIQIFQSIFFLKPPECSFKRNFTYFFQFEVENYRTLSKTEW